MFSHVHIVNGSSLVHSHLGGGTDHDHSDSQYAVIDMLSQFQSESAVIFCSAGLTFNQLSELLTGYSSSASLQDFYPVHSLRGPPHC